MRKSETYRAARRNLAQAESRLKSEDHARVFWKPGFQRVLSKKDKEALKKKVAQQ